MTTHLPFVNIRHSSFLLGPFEDVAFQADSDTRSDETRSPNSTELLVRQIRFRSILDPTEPATVK